MFEHIIVSFGIPLAYIGLGIGVLSAILFPVIQMFQDFKKAKTALIGVGAVAALFVICYLISDYQDFTKGDTYISAGQMRFIEAGIYLFYILLIGTGAAILYSTVSRYFK